jgi:hypothetical protein
MRHPSSLSVWVAVGAAILVTACHERERLEVCPEGLQSRPLMQAPSRAGSELTNIASPTTIPALGDAVDDAPSLAQAVRAALARDLRDDEILVLVDGRFVTLTGRVDDRQSLRRAMQAAHRAGAAAVHSELVVGH